MKVLNLPNALTIFRMGASVAVLYYGLQGVWTKAFPIFCLAALSDMIDGSIARIFGMRTRLGAFLDPVADKLLMFFSFLVLTLGGFIPLGLMLLIASRDLMITLGIILAKQKKIYVVYRPTYLSKMTTFAQICTVTIAFIQTQDLSRYPNLPYDKIWSFVMGTTTVLTTVTMVQYFRIGWDMLYGEKTQARHQ